MAIVPRNIDDVIKDSAGNLQVNKTVKFTPLDVFGDDGILAVLKTVKGKTNASAELKAANGTDQFSLLTNDDPGAYVRYEVILPVNTPKTFDLPAGADTTLDALIEAYDGAAAASDALTIMEIEDRLTVIEGANEFNLDDGTATTAGTFNLVGI